MNILLLFIIIPILTIIRILLSKDLKQARVTAAIGMGFQLLTSAILIYLFLAERSAGNTAEMLFTSNWVWYESLNIRFSIGVDGISVAMIGLTSIVIFAGIFAS